MIHSETAALGEESSADITKYDFGRYDVKCQRIKTGNITRVYYVIQCLNSSVIVLDQTENSKCSKGPLNSSETKSEL